jgi:hypothetical protein
MYIPILMAMSKKEFMKYSCYKIMFAIGMVDVMILPTVAIWPGIRSLLGIHFCVCPKVNFLVNSTNASKKHYGINITGIDTGAHHMETFKIWRFFDLSLQNPKMYYCDQDLIKRADPHP